ncbi:MAG: hypothetical protein K9I94_09160 [Bacteroidales bacterium]|nr:hypothetical protein [Bacteroidales bacterium]
MSEKDKHQANEPLENYEQPLNFDKVWQMFQETDKKFKETDRQFKETDRQFKETDKKFQETDRKIDRLAKLYGGVSENSRDVAEEFFRRGLESRNSIFGIRYNEVSQLARRSKHLQGEYDIVLHNSETIVVIEVKYKVHPKDVNDFVNRKLPKFKPLFKEYSGKEIIGAMAGMSIPKDSYELAADHGLLILTQSGDNISVMNPGDFKPRRF